MRHALARSLIAASVVAALLLPGCGSLSRSQSRAPLAARQEKINYKIREAQLQKIPYMLVAGDREVADGTVAVRSRSRGDLGPCPLDAFIAEAAEEMRTKA